MYPRLANGGGLSVSFARNATAIQKLLGLECGEAHWLFEQSRRIAKALGNGEVALAQILGLHIPIERLDEPQLRRLAAVSTLIKANYDPQARIPAGQPGGGEWTSDGDSPDAAPQDKRPDDRGSREFDANLVEGGYPLSKELWAVARGLYRLYRDSRGNLATLREYLADRGLKLTDLPDVVRSVFDPPKPLDELQTDKPPRGFGSETELRAYLGDPLPGYEWHHIIEQNGQFRTDLTSPEGIRAWIQHIDNMVLVPIIKHYCVSASLMSTGDGTGVRLRDVVKAHSPSAQRDIGIDLLHECGAIQ